MCKHGNSLHYLTFHFNSKFDGGFINKRISLQTAYINKQNMRLSVALNRVVFICVKQELNRWFWYWLVIDFTVCKFFWRKRFLSVTVNHPLPFFNYDVKSLSHKNVRRKDSKSNYKDWRGWWTEINSWKTKFFKWVGCDLWIIIFRSWIWWY